MLQEAGNNLIELLRKEYGGLKLYQHIGLSMVGSKRSSGFGMHEHIHLVQECTTHDITQTVFVRYSESITNIVLYILHSICQNRLGEF